MMESETVASREYDTEDGEVLKAVSPFDHDALDFSESELKIEGLHMNEQATLSTDNDDDNSLVVARQASFVVGEDSESEEEQGDAVDNFGGNGDAWIVADDGIGDGIGDDIGDDIGDASDLIDDDEEELHHRPTCIEGEASESSEDDFAEEGNGMQNYVEEPQKIQYRNISGSSAEKTPSTPSLLASPQKLAKDATDSVLHHKLRETNANLKDAIDAQWQKMLKSTAKDLSSIGQNFQRTRQITQETSHSMRTLTNNLFKIEDSVDIVASCDLLPKIYLK